MTPEQLAALVAIEAGEVSHSLTGWNEELHVMWIIHDDDHATVAGVREVVDKGWARELRGRAVLTPAGSAKLAAVLEGGSHGA